MCCFHLISLFLSFTPLAPILRSQSLYIVLIGFIPVVRGLRLCQILPDIDSTISLLRRKCFTNSTPEKIREQSGIKAEESGVVGLVGRIKRQRMSEEIYWTSIILLYYK